MMWEMGIPIVNPVQFDSKSIEHSREEESISSIDERIFTVAKYASPDALPHYSKDWYWNMRKDGLITPDELTELNSTYYPRSPNIFVGSATRYGPMPPMMKKLIDLKPEIRDQMKRGWVLTGSGEYGYHPELADKLKTWIPTSLYGSDLNPNNILLDNRASPVYVFNAEQRLGGPYNHPLPVLYKDLNDRQKLLFDLTANDVNYIWEHIVPIEQHQQWGPGNALESNTYVSLIATKSPNDIGRRFLLFHRNENDEVVFDGVTLVVDVASRADWTGTGAILDPTSRYNPLMLRLQPNERGEWEQWGFDLPNELYYHISPYGKEDRAVFGVIAIDAEVVESWTR